MLEAPPPLLVLVHRLLPVLGLPLQRDDRRAGTKNAAASATTAAKVGIVASTTSSSGAMTNAMNVVAWRQSRNDIDNNNEDNNQCR
jgi:hypothetical protein